MKSFIRITLLAVLLISVTACNKKSRPNYQYMPNMYESVGYETYQEGAVFSNGIEAQLPAKGTIPRGYIPFDVKNTNGGYSYAKFNVKSKLNASQINLAKGKELYEIYCGICHGNKGKGQGKLVKREKILGVPSYGDREITEGSVYHTIYYGKNAMGSYANQLNEEERWQVTAYVMKLRSEIKK